MPTRFCSKIKSAIFINEETGRKFVLSIGDLVFFENEGETISDHIDYFFTKNGEVIVNGSLYDDIDPISIITINDERI